MQIFVSFWNSSLAKNSFYDNFIFCDQGCSYYQNWQVSTLNSYDSSFSAQLGSTTCVICCLYIFSVLKCWSHTVMLFLKILKAFTYFVSLNFPLKINGNYCQNVLMHRNPVTCRSPEYLESYQSNYQCWTKCLECYSLSVGN